MASVGPEELKAGGALDGPNGFWQPALEVNYPGGEAFTRIVELKHATGQQCPNSTLVREYPTDYGTGVEPFYPIPAPDAKKIYNHYKELARREQNITFIGRLAGYRYFNMDQVVALALKEFENLNAKYSPGLERHTLELVVR